ncbi:VOC family protein [Roseibium sp. ROS1]
MLHHVEIYVSNIRATYAFWIKILARIGYRETSSWEDGFTLRRKREAYLTFVQVSDKHKDHKYHRSGVGLNHIAFKIQERADVDAMRQYCIENSITILYDDRYPFASGIKDYYALFIEDPDRIKIEFVAGH